jgi:hypothetical protein
MGWGLCMAVVEGLSAEEIAVRLDMDLTEDRVAYYTGALHMVGLRRDGRGFVVMDTGADVMPLADERLLAQAQPRHQGLGVRDQRDIDRYAVSCWAIGVMDWKVTHSHEDSRQRNSRSLASHRRSLRPSQSGIEQSRSKRML